MTVLGELTADEIEHLLSTETVARLGCHADGRTYVVPVTYAYDGRALIIHSAEGLKVWMMRENWDVCVEVDRIAGPTDWACVIAHGTFQELDGAEAAAAMAVFRERFASTTVSATARAAAPEAVSPAPTGRKDLTRKKAVVYRILLKEKTGRFERSG